MKKIIIFLAVTISIMASETVVLDGLGWQDNSQAKSIKRDWSGAKNYCQTLSLGGDSDWRLPTIKELQSIVDIKRYKPAIEKGFKNTASARYWSSSQIVPDEKQAWRVNFGSGLTMDEYKSNKFYVRCVRGRQ